MTEKDRQMVKARWNTKVKIFTTMIPHETEHKARQDLLLYSLEVGNFLPSLLKLYLWGYPHFLLFMILLLQTDWFHSVCWSFVIYPCLNVFVHDITFACDVIQTWSQYDYLPWPSSNCGSNESFIDNLIYFQSFPLVDTVLLIVYISHLVIVSSLLYS